MYGTEAGSLVYAALVGNATWPLLTLDEREAALQVGTTYLDGTYRIKFSGSKVGARAQVDEWPRTGATDMNGDAIDSGSVPQEAITANYEAAFRQGAAPGSLTPDYDPLTAQVIREKFDVFETQWATPQPDPDRGKYGQPIYSVIDNIIRPILTSPLGVSEPAFLVV